MKALLLITLLLVGIGIGYPLANEETANVCSALERRLITVLSAQDGDRSTAVFFGAFQSSFSDGAVARSLIKLRDPNTLPVLACGIAYWRLVLDRNGAEAMLNELVTAKQIGGEAVDSGAKALSPAAEAERAMRALTNPAPAAAPKSESAPAPGYRPGDQRALDRVIGTQR